MRVLLIDTNWAPFDLEDEDNLRKLDEPMRRAIEEADLVVHMFSPHAPHILKAPPSTLVQEAEERSWFDEYEGTYRTGWVLLNGSADMDVCHEEAQIKRDMKKHQR